MTPTEQDKELFRLASLIGCEPEDEARHRQQLLDYVQTAYTNKQIEAVLDRLELSMRGKTIVDTAEGWQKFVKRHVVASIEAERNKLNRRNYDTYK